MDCRGWSMRPPLPSSERHGKLLDGRTAHPGLSNGRGRADPQPGNFAGRPASAPAAISCWRRRRFRCFGSTRSLPTISRAQRPAAYTKRAWHTKSLAAKTTSSAPPIPTQRWPSCAKSAIISALTRCASWSTTAPSGRRRGLVLGCGSIPSIRRRKATPSMTPVRRVRGWGFPAPRWEMPCRRASRAYIFTRCVNRMLRRWWRRLKRSRKSSGNFYTGCAG